MNKHISASDTISYLESLRNEKQRAVLMRFFKTGPGQYGESDVVIEIIRIFAASRIMKKQEKTINY
ncbi:MAG: hypothetical protein J6X65_09520 [Bacteroidales bacterium]|nr:hypothetical protein [Bacteroidales bacterium]